MPAMKTGGEPADAGGGGIGSTYVSTAAARRDLFVLLLFLFCPVLNHAVRLSVAVLLFFRPCCFAYAMPCCPSVRLSCLSKPCPCRPSHAIIYLLLFCHHERYHVYSRADGIGIHMKDTLASTAVDRRHRR